MRAIVSLFILALAWATPAFAEAPPPLGYWATQDGSEELLVSASGCRFHAVQGTDVVGTCSWNATSGGGILTITYPGYTGPQHVYFNIVYVNQTTISVFGDIFYRRG